MGTAGTVLTNRAIARCEAAWALSALGTWAFAIVLALYAYYEHGPAGVGFAVAARMVPAAIFAGLPALVARRWSRRSAVLASALARFAALEAVALVAALDGPFALLLALAGVFEIAGGVHFAARAELVLESARTPEDLAVLGSSRVVSSVGFLAGAVAGAVIVLTVSLQAAFAVAGVAFLPAALLAWQLPVVAGSPGSGARAPDDLPRLRDGLRVLRRQPWMRLRVGLFGIGVLFDSTLDLLLVVAALELLHAGDGGVGWLRAAFACGGLIIGAVVATALRAGRLATAATAGLALAGIPLALVPVWPVMAPALVLIALLGAGYALLEASLLLLSQRLVTEEAAIGAVSVEDYVYPLARAAGAGLGAWLVLQLGDTAAVVAAGLLLPSVAIIAIRPLLRAERSVELPARALELLSGLPLLSSLPASAVENLSLRARREQFEGGATILHQDQPNAKLYVIDRGAVECLDQGGSTTQLEAGSCFGRSAILRDTRQHSSVTASTPVTAWTVTRSDFIRCLGGPAQRAAEATSAVPSPGARTAAPVG